MKLCAFIFVLFTFLGAKAQITISGKILEKNGAPISLINVYLKNTTDGSITGENGNFFFETSASGEAILIVRGVGYKTVEKIITIGHLDLNFEIIVGRGESLSEVVITAGAFEASDEKKGTILKPLDIVTNPAASADIYGALLTLPGVTPVQNETGLFVRGGEASETKTIIDGAYVAKPFFSETPDIPARGRFNPFLFKGTLFSTGGYSAQYGQALSSVLILNTNDIPSISQYSLGLNMAGINGSYTQVWNDNTALLANASYTNLSALFSIVPQNREWINAPSGFGSTVGFRHLSDEGNLFKSYVQYQKGNVALSFNDNSGIVTDNEFENKNQNLFFNNSYKGFLGENWKVLAVASLSYDKDNDVFNQDKTVTKDWLIQGRLTFTRELGSTRFRIGNESQVFKNEYVSNEIVGDVKNTLTSFYVESDFKLNKKFALRTGGRSEYASAINKFNFMPRISLSYKAGSNSQVSLAYGTFYQIPKVEFLRESTSINFEKASHFIANYQWKKNKRVFRAEVYYKSYDDLILTNSNVYGNQGHGFAKGLDIFWRDQKTVPNLNYWLSYSLLDSKRLYEDFPELATPEFASSHTINLVANYNLTSRKRLGIAYTFSSGRPYFNPNNPVFLADQTIDYLNINVSASYLTSIFGNFTVIYASLKNPFGIKQIFGYRYSEDGSFRTPIIPSSDWSFFAGVSISFRKNQKNE